MKSDILQKRQLGSNVKRGNIGGYNYLAIKASSKYFAEYYPRKRFLMGIIGDRPKNENQLYVILKWEVSLQWILKDVLTSFKTAKTLMCIFIILNCILSFRKNNIKGSSYYSALLRMWILMEMKGINWYHFQISHT